eukprot:scaffold93294_cov27-Tisochrysis_lutea.AAC.1
MASTHPEEQVVRPDDSALVGVQRRWTSVRSCATRSELLRSSRTSSELTHLGLPPSIHAASVGADQLSFGKTSPPNRSIASSISRRTAANEAGSAGAGVSELPSSDCASRGSSAAEEVACACELPSSECASRGSSSAVAETFWV